MPNWALFAGLSILLAIVMLALARITADILTPDDGDEADGVERAPSQPSDRRDPRPSPDRPVDSPMSQGALLANAALSHALLGGVLVAMAWYAEIPAAALGLEPTPGWLGVGAALGVGLYVANEIGSVIVRRLGVDADEHLREVLAPSTAGGWVALLLVVLPTVAGVEELLFRGALIGVLAAGYGLPPWGLAVGSSILFGLGHGLQGPGGILVTALLGFVLAATFVLTGSLLVVIVAHYLVNVLEFVVREGFDLDLPSGG